MKQKKIKPNLQNRDLTEEEKEDIISELLPYIKYTALRLAWRLPSQLNVEDLMSAGVVGLLDAINRYKEDKGSLPTFVKYRIKGAMLDELNEYNTIPKSQKKKMDMIKKACIEMEKDFGRMPEDEEIADAIGLTLDEYYEIIQSSQAATIHNIEGFTQRQGNGEEINLAEIIPDDSSDNPMKKLEERDKKRWLAELINELPKREKLILSLYYWDELTMKEIAVIMEMTEGRVCQLHRKALLWLKAKIQSDDRIKEFF
jgi:RNA polymerase sigma factor for flagellar operon FliA